MTNNPRARRERSNHVAAGRSAAQPHSGQNSSARNGASKKSSARDETPHKRTSQERNVQSRSTQKAAGQRGGAQERVGQRRPAQKGAAQAQRQQCHPHERIANKPDTVHERRGGIERSFRPTTAHPGPSRMPSMPSKRRDGRGKKVALIAAAAVLVVALCLGGVAFAAVGQAGELKAKASEAMADINAVMDDVQKNDYTGAANAAIGAKSAADDIHEQLNGPLWGVLSVMPVVGDDIRNVRTAVEALQLATEDALVPLTIALQTTPLSDLVGGDGSINIDAMNALLAAVQKAAPAMQECADMIEGLPDFNLPQIQSSFGGAKDKIAPMNEKFQQLSALAPIIGMLLGSDGDRKYMLAAQNSAELRAAGGFPGSIGTLEIEDGLITMGDFEKVYDALPESAMPADANITDVELKLFDDEKSHLSRTNDLGAIPDFERVASLWASVYAERGEHLDGVISITPSVVQDILKTAGSITLSDGTMLDGTNATKVLEHDLYWKYLGTDADATKNADLVDALFAEAAAKAMDKLFSNLGSGGLMGLVKTILSDMETREFMVWLTDEEEQAKLDVLNCSGGLGGSIADPELGIYISIMTPSKLGWYLDADTQVGEPVQNADGTTTYPVTTTVTNSLTAQERSQGSNYIIGRSTYYHYPEGDIHPWVYFVAPEGGSITDLADDAQSTIISDMYNGVQVYRAIVAMNVGENATYTYNVTVAAGAEQPLKVTGTPLLTEYRTAG